MKPRITTRAGRRIEHLGPGHVRDVATSMVWVKLPLYPAARHAADFRWFPGRTDTCIFGGERTLDAALNLLNVGAGICALVQALLALGEAGRDHLRGVRRWEVTCRVLDDDTGRWFDECFVVEGGDEPMAIDNACRKLARTYGHDAAFRSMRAEAISL